MSEKMITIFTIENETDTEEECLGSAKSMGEKLVAKVVSSNIFKGNVKSFIENLDLNSLANEVQPAHQGFQLDEISITLSVTATGEVGLLGTGVGGRVMGGITLVFKRNQ